MKLIITIIQERDRQAVADALSQAGFLFTKVASTGGFLRDGNVTFLLGVEDGKVDQALAVIKDSSTVRDQYSTIPAPEAMPGTGMLQSPVQVSVGGAVTFVLDVESFHRW